MNKRIASSRNLFEIENARNLSPEEVVQTFVTTQAFWRLLSPKNHILLGSRGSGKTAVAKMLSHDHLSRLDRDKAKEQIENKSFIGIYVPIRLEWIGGLLNKPWQNEEEKKSFFRWRLNIATCSAFLNTMRSCLAEYSQDKGHHAELEYNLSVELSKSWNDEEQFYESLDALQIHLEDVEYKKLLQINRKRVMGALKTDEVIVGLVFDLELFAPLRRGIALASRVFNFSPDTTAWLLCLDEAEFLEEDHQRILNSCIRAYSGNLFFKITTMPYRHLTSDTTTHVSLDPGHDFEYIYMDRDPVFLERTPSENTTIGTSFARKLYRRRAAASDLTISNFKIEDILGPSDILDPKTEDWGQNSQNMELLLKYGSEETKARALKIHKDKKFRAQIGRKIHGALLLRDNYAKCKGSKKLDVYSGATMAMRCGDTNPRRLVRIFNSMILAFRWPKSKSFMRKKKQVIPKVVQTEKLLQLSTQLLTSVQSEREFGPDLYNFLTMIGEYMFYSFHFQPLTTDQVSSIRIGKDIQEHEWKMIQRAVSLGLLYPNINPNNPDELPVKQGTFHLAYALAPHFGLLPRKGKALAISTIRRKYPKVKKTHNFNERGVARQLRLYENI